MHSILRRNAGTEPYDRHSGVRRSSNQAELGRVARDLPRLFAKPTHAFISSWLNSRNQTDSPVVVGNIGTWPHDNTMEIFNSAEFVAPDGQFLGRYDKIHLVPFGEYVPYKGLIAFAGTLTQGVGSFSRGGIRKVFTAQGHTFGAFICYEAVFADEVRHFAKNGARSSSTSTDDGWYGDTSAPWQHFNMARMRAIENRRWILRATNSGVTAAIDPFGRVTQSAPRHVLTSLAVRYGYRSDVTFYSSYGDVFAILCAIIAIVATLFALRVSMRQRPTESS